jgi:hypothetical protein
MKKKKENPASSAPIPKHHSNLRADQINKPARAMIFAYLETLSLHLTLISVAALPLNSLKVFFF